MSMENPHGDATSPATKKASVTPVTTPEANTAPLRGPPHPGPSYRPLAMSIRPPPAAACRSWLDNKTASPLSTPASPAQLPGSALTAGSPITVRRISDGHPPSGMRRGEQGRPSRQPNTTRSWTARNYLATCSWPCPAPVTTTLIKVHRGIRDERKAGNFLIACSSLRDLFVFNAGWWIPRELNVFLCCVSEPRKRNVFVIRAVDVQDRAGLGRHRHFLRHGFRHRHGRQQRRSPVPSPHRRGGR